MLAWQGDAGRTLALVENKIAAAFQPEQGTRYAARAAKWATMVEVASVRTVLIAPSDYLSRPGCEMFDMQIGYEEVAAVLRQSGDLRSCFLADTLEGGVAAYRRGYTLVPNEEVSAVWKSIWSVAQQAFPSLRMQAPSAKPGKSTWIYFRDAVGFEGDRGKAVVVYKAERGQADLQFSNTSAGALAALAKQVLKPGMLIAPAKKSACIRLTVPPVNFRSETAVALPDIEEGLAACEQLRELYSMNRGHFSLE